MFCGQHLEIRITPAWAGKRALIGAQFFQLGDHPRVGGEKPSQKGCGSCPAGSPPRGRGKGPCLCRCSARDGITPARAGKSTSSGPAAASSRDHPRMGGEKRLHDASFCRVRGSPPRGRGKVSNGFCAARPDRITPAWAGKRAACWCRCTIPEDHPRVGGEKRLIVVMLYAAVGSPPRGRGKARHLSHGLLPCG